MPEFNLAEAIGLAAAACTTTAFIPQALHILRDRDTKAISLGMYSVFALGVALWLVYGVMITSIPVIAANGVTLIFVLTILAAKIRYG